MTPNPHLPDHPSDDDAVHDDSALAESKSPGAASSEPDIDEFLAGIWAEELAYLNAHCLDDPMSEADDDWDLFDEIEHGEREWIPSNSQPDESFPLTTELVEVGEQAFLDGLALSVWALSENVASREVPAAGSRLNDSDRVRIYTAADRVRDLTERVVAVEQAVRVLDAARSCLYAQIPASFSAATLRDSRDIDSEEGVTSLETDADYDGSATHPDSRGVGVLSAANLIALKTRTSDQTVKTPMSHAFTLTEELPEVPQPLRRDVSRWRMPM